MLTDTHAHLYWDSYKGDLDQVIQRSIEAGVTTVINVGVDVQLSIKAAEQVKMVLNKIPQFRAYSTIGIHPHEAHKYSSDVSIHEGIEQLGRIYQENRSNCVAVGECGLDYVEVDEQIKDMQRQLFQAQIDLAKKLNLPLLVHCRDDRSKNPTNSEAWNEVLEMAGDHPTVLHCYSGLSKITNLVLNSSNLFVSFAGNITYPKNEYLREAAKVLPIDRICFETDSPFLSPQSKRGMRNEPSSVLEVAQLVAAIKGLSLEKVAMQTTNNVKELFAFPG